MKDCIGTLSANKPTGVLINYAVSSAGPWSTSSSGTSWIRFSTNNGSTWSTPVKYVGTNGTNGTDATGATILYNGLLGSDLLSGSGTFNKTYTLPAGTLVNAGDVIKLTAVYELSTTSNNATDFNLGLYHTSVIGLNVLGMILIEGQITLGTTTVRLEVNINMINDTEFFVEYTVYRSPGVIEDSPTQTTLSGVFSASTSSLNILPGIINGGGTNIGVELLQFKVELNKIVI